MIIDTPLNWKLATQAEIDVLKLTHLGSRCKDSQNKYKTVFQSYNAYVKPGVLLSIKGHNDFMGDSYSD
jgi:hypothetical protein